MLNLSACLSLGQKALPEGPEIPQYTLSACGANAKAPVLAIQGKQLPLQVLSTAKTPWNTHLRYVYPYTKNTVQFEVSVSHPLNQTDGAASSVTLAEAVALQLNDSNKTVNSLPFSYWQKVWPANAARSGQELHDRSIAMGEVIKQRWQTRMLYPGESYTAVVVFPQAVLSQAPQQLLFKYQTSQAPATEETLTLCLTPQTQ